MWMNGTVRDWDSVHQCMHAGLSSQPLWWMMMLTARWGPPLWMACFFSCSTTTSSRPGLLSWSWCSQKALPGCHYLLTNCAAYPLLRSAGRLHSQMWTTHGLCYSAGFLGPMQTTPLLFFALNPSFFSLQELKQWSWAVTGHSGPSSDSKESWSPRAKILDSETRTEDKHIKRLWII